MNLIYTLRTVRRNIGAIVRKDERRILIVCIVIASILVVAIVGAAVYNSMSMGSSIGVE